MQPLRVRVLGLDASSKTGFAVLERREAKEGDVVALVDYGLVRGKRSLKDSDVPYPWSLIGVTRETARLLGEKVAEVRPDVVVIEETNPGGRAARYDQKYLEYLHSAFLLWIERYPEAYGVAAPEVCYLSSGSWRHALGLKLSKSDQRNNRLVKKAKETGVAKKVLGVKGKVNAKHLSVRWANAAYDLALKQGDHDVAEAIAIGTAFLAGAVRCDGLK